MIHYAPKMLSDKAIGRRGRGEKEWMVVEESQITVQIIDSSAFGRAALTHLVEADPQLKVVGVARNSEDGIQQVLELSPDLVLLTFGPDSGEQLEILRQIMKLSPLPVVLLTHPNLSLSEHLEALETGAVMGIPFEVTNSSARLMAFQSLLASRIKSLHMARARSGPLVTKSDTATSTRPIPPERVAPQPFLAGPQESPDASPHPGRPRSPLPTPVPNSLVHPRRDAAIEADTPRRAEVAVFGATTGGIRLLCQIAKAIPADTQLAMLAVVHLPDDLLEILAERLDAECAIRVIVSQEGEPLKPGVLQFAPGGKNLGMVRTGRIPKALTRLLQPEPGMGSIPSLDPTLRACATVYGPGTFGLILTGLSKDGLEGFHAIKSRGGWTAVIDPDLAIVSSTNQVCIDAGVVDEVITPEDAIKTLLELGKPLQLPGTGAG